MVIGYGFADAHINARIVAASAQSELGIFLLDPRGCEVFKRNHFGAIQQPNPLDDIRLIGISTRQLRHTLSGDELEFAQLDRFFQ